MERKAAKDLSEKRDIVILMRGVKNYGDVFYKILTENNLPAYIDDNDGFFDTMEINAFLSALQIIDNPKQDIHLLTLMRSEMMGFSIEEMVKIRIEFKNGSYYEAFSSYAKSRIGRRPCRKVPGGALIHRPVAGSEQDNAAGQAHMETDA